MFESQPSVHKSKISQSKEKRDESVKINFTNPMDFQHETFPDKENPKTTFSRNEAEDDRDKSDKSEPQVVVNKLPRRRWNEARSPDSFSTSHRRDPRLNREQYPAPRSNTGEAGDVPPRHNFEEAGDVPPDRFYIPNGSMNRRSIYQITSESSRVVAEFNYSGSCSNEIRRRSNSTRPSDNLAERKAPGEKTHQCEDNVKEDVSVVLTTDQNVTIRDTQEALSETNLSTDSKGKSQSNLYNEDIVTCDKSVTEEDKGKQNWKQCSIEVIEMAKKRSDHNLVLMDAQKEKTVNQHTKIPMKCGLDAACGDFISSVNDANEQNDDYETIFIDLGENEGNRTQQNNEISRGISMEYFEEVIGKVIEEQKDAQEDLNISFYPESDSSYIEIEESSDFSDTDDFTMQDQ